MNETVSLTVKSPLPQILKLAYIKASPMPSQPLDRVDYTELDRAKNAFIAASKKTLGFAKKYGFVPGKKLGASANVFSLNLAPYLKRRDGQLFITLLPEGLGTADDARPDDLSQSELRQFWRNIGIKTVATMTNDAAATGMQPILISLYLPTHNPSDVFTPAFMDGFLKGFVEGCKRVGCVYFSGETPQLKTKIVPGRLDIAGALFGVMPAGRAPITSEDLRVSDLIVFVESSGPHENGFTTLRHLAEKLPRGYRTKLPSGTEYWEAINAPSHLYTPLVQDILAAGIKLTNIEPITGHGWLKLMRSKKPFRYVIENMLPVPEVFSCVEEASGMSKKDMLQTFNYGVGSAIFVRDKKDAQRIIKLAGHHKLKAIVAGRVELSKRREVVVKPFDIILSTDNFTLSK